MTKFANSVPEMSQSEESEDSPRGDSCLFLLYPNSGLSAPAVAGGSRDAAQQSSIRKLRHWALLVVHPSVIYPSTLSCVYMTRRFQDVFAVLSVLESAHSLSALLTLRYRAVERSISEPTLQAHHAPTCASPKMHKIKSQFKMQQLRHATHFEDNADDFANDKLSRRASSNISSRW